MKFSKSDRVVDLKTKRSGTVLCVINAGDPKDVRAQGFRYEVRLSDGWVYSIPEKCLRAK